MNIHIYIHTYTRIHIISYYMFGHMYPCVDDVAFLGLNFGGLLLASWRLHPRMRNPTWHAAMCRCQILIGPLTPEWEQQSSQFAIQSPFAIMCQMQS